MATSLKYATKQLIWSCCRHRRGHAKDIFLFSTRRGGSTLLMETIAANRGVRYIDQPFSLFTASRTHRNQLPHPPLSQFITLDQESERRVHDFVERLLSGDLSVNAPWEFWSPEFDFRTSRSVLKIVDAKPLIDWFGRQFDVHTVFSTRHPIPTSLSIMRNGWGLTAPAYLANEEYMLALSDRQTAFAHDVMRGRKELSKHVLNWGLENLIPVRLLPEREDWLYVSSERAATEPLQTVQLLAERLGLGDKDAMLARLTRPSRSTKRLHSETVATGASPAAIEGWRRHVTDDDIRDAMNILDTFEIPLYSDTNFNTAPSLR